MVIRKKNKVYTSSISKEFPLTVRELSELMSLRGLLAKKQLEKQFPQGAEQICDLLESSSTIGISGDSTDLDRRKYNFGPNLIPLKPMKKFIVFVYESTQDITLIILMFAAVVSLVLGFCLQGDDAPNSPEGDDDPVWIEGVAIAMAVMVVVLVTSVNDWKKEKQFRGLQVKIEDTQHRDVLRNGLILQIAVHEIVVGDICMVKYGDLMATDAIVIDSSDLQADESSFTGESELVKKSAESDPMLFSGTYVMEGTARVVVTAVGVNSQAGNIYSLLAGVDSTNAADDNESAIKVSKGKEKSVLQAKLTLLAIKIGYMGTIIAILTVVIMVLRFSITKFIYENKPWNSKFIQNYLRFFIIGVTVLVVAVPEGLPLAVTLALAYSVRRMMFDNNLVRHLDACETMGNATAICSDKTGTLTTNRMTVMQIYVSEKHFIDRLPLRSELSNTAMDITIQCICLNSSFTSKIIASENEQELPLQVGNKTECALLSFLLNFGLDYASIRESTPKSSFVKVYTFNSDRKYMSTVIKHPNKAGAYRVLAKGATEYILDRCKFVLGESASVLRYEDEAKQLSEVTMDMAQMGMRTLAMAYKDIITTGTATQNESEMSGNIDWSDSDKVVKDMTCVCIIGIEDPVRPEVPFAIRKCQRAGITVRMLTGDSLETARSIALKCGITRSNDDALIVESSTFNQMIRKKPDGPIDQEMFDKVWPKLRVLARSSPMDKYNLVKGMIESTASAMREVVAVTGDGTNDGPALKIADVGFAMGIAGTDVAKEASDIILMDDNFDSLVKAVMWGRNVYDSISKFLQFQLTVNLVAVSIAFFGACVLNTSPLKAIQMLWVNLIMDTLASLALATERPSEDLLNRKPYGRTQPLITTIMLRNIFCHAFYQILVIVLVIRWGPDWFDVDWGFSGTDKHYATHTTIIFNSFVMMTLFNELNSRKLHGQRNVFSGLQSNAIFSSIWIVTMFVQIFIIEFGSTAFDVTSLSLDHWLWCVFLGIGSLLWGQLVISLPAKKFTSTFFFPPSIYQSNGEMIRKMVDGSENASAILWVRGNKLISQEESKNEYNSGYTQIFKNTPSY